MNQTQQLLAQAHRMRKELDKAQAQLDAKEFTVEKNGMVKVVVLGNRHVKSIEIDPDAMSEDNKEMVEEAIALAINEAMDQITKEKDEMEERITGQTGGFGF